MTLKPTLMLDPEYVIPSSSASQELTFWKRMNEQASNTSLKLGPETLKALRALTASPPTVPGLPVGEFWKIIGKYMARGFRQENPGKTICKTHVTDNYSPDKGHADNTEALSADLSASGANSYLVLFTPFAASIAPSPSCDICSRSRLAIAGSAATDLEARRLASPAYRALFLEKSSKSYVELDDNKHDLFPDIEFSDGSFARIRTLTGSEDDNVAGLVRDLGVLNDAAQDLWSSYTNTHDREVAFGALGVTASPEGPSKHKNRKAMDARIFSFTEGDVMCEWHTKLRPDINRVYFAVSKGKVKVGLITDHLP